MRSSWCNRTVGASSGNAVVIDNRSIRSKSGKVTIAGHPSQELAPKTLRSILRTGGAEFVTFTIIYEKTCTGYSAYVPDLPGCVAAGATVEETADLMRGAIDLHLGGMREDGDPIPEATTLAGTIAVSV